jgi:PAS domain S-box-containing protein
MPDETASLPAAVDILLVDDRPENLLALEVVLSELGENLIRAGSGEEALRLLADRDFAVVLLDVRMPGLSGFETAERMRASDRTQHTPIIFLSASTSDEFPVVEAYKLGAVDYLLKPLIPDILRAKVTVFVDLFRKGERVRNLERRERERAEAALRESEGRLRQLADNLPAGFIYQIVLTGEKPRFTYVSGGIEPLLGVTPEEVIADSRRLYRLIHEDDFLGLRAAEEEAVRTGVPFDCRFRTHGRGGEIRWLHCRSASRPLDGGGSVWDGIATDITDRVRVEEDLRRKQAELTDFIENATVGLHWIGPDGTILWANRAELNLLGYAKDEYVGHNIAEFHVDPPVIADILCRLTDGEELHGYEARLRCKDGSVRHVLLSSNVYRECGVFRHTRCFTRDITDRKRAEEEVQEQYRRKDQFLATLAHELRNPLAPIRNALQILALRGGDPGVVNRVREMMDRQVTHLGRLVDDLLDVSRIATGKVQLRKERLDLVSIARQAVAAHQAAFDAKRVSLGMSAATSLWVSGDPTRLAQVLDNLLVNALKFTAQDGEVSVSVAPAGAHGILTVRDTGAGVEPEMLPRLFEPLSQADRTLDRSAGGLGLGLAIVKGLVELHGGAVRAESAGLGQGAVFTVTLPTEGEPAALSGPSGSARTCRRKLRILVVEDNRDSADSLRMLLETHGYEVEVAYTGPDGVRAAGEHRPEVVICDIGLPGLDGYGVAAALRRNPDTASARLIALTGYGQDEDRRRAREAGFDEHLTKPADPTALEALLAASE